MSTLMRHNNVENVNYEDIRVSYDDGPYRNFGTKELTVIFGYVPIEPSMDIQIKAFGSKKAAENSDVVGGYRHTQVERCFIFSWWTLALYRVHTEGENTFNFHVDVDGEC